ncbi:MAG: dTDP-4-dehydrorhamnose 3,5-epimerase [Ferruginibacter sp.]|nr:dTDP-4-dehydrorhamnose 3,5-epimerase [Bacteroidota bacterium]MBX2919249.1 dTDP-4-dehydrorhamnose 3,5-epimerase [Ferruginibacter sp.]MCC7378678.1 dTDP-4-dehydrorhamnose 3,5-epimerase [Chitinophagaceae bacterium]
MAFFKTEFPGLLIIEPTVFTDSRGYFFESYNENNFKAEGIDIKFVQDNQSKSSYGVIRGLHYQLAPYAQTKLIRVLSGVILDVVVDLRKGSPTFGKSFSLELSAQNNKQLFIPKGFAHGFSVLSDTAEVLYKCDAFYNKASEAGIAYNDKELEINWQIPAQLAIISDKDKINPLFKDCKNNFNF